MEYAPESRKQDSTDTVPLHMNLVWWVCKEEKNSKLKQEAWFPHTLLLKASVKLEIPEYD